eukprot:gene5879-2075_t
MPFHVCVSGNTLADVHQLLAGPGRLRRHGPGTSLRAAARLRRRLGGPTGAGGCLAAPAKPAAKKPAAPAKPAAKPAAPGKGPSLLHSHLKPTAAMKK